jgi:mannose-1-phosphate guanylyltransferase
MLLCAGLGTRLRPLTDERPKPLVPVFDRPLASFALERLAAAGVRHVVANTHHLPEQVLPALGPYAQKLNLAFETVHEPTLLGTGGGIRNALPRLGHEPFVVFNGDILAAPDLTAALALHTRLGARITMVLREDPRAGALGAIEVNGEGRVLRILDEGPAPSELVRRCLFTGVYVVSPDIEADLPAEGCVVRHTLRRLLARGDVVAGLVDGGPWFDLGTLATYAEVNFGLLDGSIAYPGVEAPFEARLVDPLARVGSGIRLGHRVVVGARASLAGEGRIERAIVWEDAVVRAPMANTIATGGGLRVGI